ncbi:GNAT family N-acetyltransferase [Pseudomonas viridiflava]|uniref:GNAT family N-acetyltransferase n=1 Tax=Pseudomonas viridiflava TaxID=33069 RepID=UPI002A6A4064|nr:GNAT family N-acetyltransferase [Pseudomonas viridiflava]MDY0917617.1 GNAT family N-acetyltransferase [Pseudomonas viridiflava]
MNNTLELRAFDETQYTLAYAQAEALFQDGGQSPFAESGYYSSLPNEPLHFYLENKLVATATLLFMNDGAEVHKLYVHPSARGRGIGRAAAIASIDYLFATNDLEDVGVSILGDSAKFWSNIVTTYGDRALYAYPNCYFVKPGDTAKNQYPFAFENDAYS